MTLNNIIIDGGSNIKLMYEHFHKHLNLPKHENNDFIVRMDNHFEFNRLGILWNVNTIIHGMNVLVTLAMLELPQETQYPVILGMAKRYQHHPQLDIQNG